MKTSIFFLIFPGLLFFFQSCNNPKDKNPTKKPALKQKLVKKKKKNQEAKENLPKILIDSLLINHLTGQCVYEKDTCFKVVPKHATTKKIYLQKETCDMFLKMKSAAEKDSVFLKINSGARNFNVQKYIWEKRWDGKKRLRDGSSAKNWEISTKRAIAVVELMINSGMDPKTIIASGRSSYQPLAPNDTEANKSKNRRTEIILIPKPQ